MAQEIQKQTAGTLTFQKQPEEFLTRLGIYLDTMQKVYRTKLPESELHLWLETLKDYSFQEFDRAMKSLIAKPPKQELEDGTIQVWRGMPKLPDVLQVMMEFRESDMAEFHRREREADLKEEMQYRQKVEAHPEDYIPVRLTKALEEATGGKERKVPAKVFEMPKAEPRLSVHTAEREQELERQKEKLLREAGQK